MMCEYCNGDDILFKSIQPWGEVEIIDGILDFRTDELCIQISIKYCPMCGERLTE